jgi:NAD(P)-dependent dehydrogenase (short-subunit alcohol dehydrogenase family)
MRLEDKVAIVTGGGGGLGEGICLALAQEGAHVVVSDLSIEQAQKTARRVAEFGHKATAVKTDVRNKADCLHLVDSSLEFMGQLDILVCCAGVGGFATSENSGVAILENITEQEWDLTLDVNLKGVFLCVQAAVPHFKKQKSGKIINISSIAGRRGVDFIPHYCASKSGVLVFSQAVALQLAPFNINVNCVCPGMVLTEMWRQGARALSHSEVFEAMDLEAIFDASVELKVPMKRPQTPADIGHAVVFLASPESEQITGQALNVDGGAVMN